MTHIATIYAGLLSLIKKALMIVTICLVDSTGGHGCPELCETAEELRGTVKEKRMVERRVLLYATTLRELEKPQTPLL